MGMEEVCARAVEGGMTSRIRVRKEAEEELERSHEIFDYRKSILRSGCTVMLINLRGAPELNGQRGKCESWDAKREQWSVRLSDGDVKAIRPCNLAELNAT